MNHWYSKGLPGTGKRNTENPYDQQTLTVIKMLGLKEYCGDVINFKTYFKSYKTKIR